MPTAGAKPAHARHVLGWTSVSSPSYSAGSRKPLIRWIGKTQIDGGDRILPIERRNTKSPGPRFPLLEVRLWQEAKSNLVTIDCYFGLSGLESRLRVEAASSLSTGCKALCLDAAGRVSGRTGRGRGVNFVTLARSSLTRHVALPDHGVGLDGQSCSCLIVGWPVGLSSPTLGVGRPSVVSEHGFVHASGTHDLIGFKYLSSQNESQKALGKPREFEAKPKPEAEEERQIQRTGLWYGLDRWEETRLRWERTSSVFGKRKIEKDLRNLDKATVRDDPAIIQLKTIVEALRRTLKERLWPE
ncbi:hypothetical protein YC2023_042525 [Brassica napus]